MKVLHLTHYYDPHIGGVEKHVSRVVAHHAAEGIESTIITKLHQESLPRTEVIKGTMVIRIPVASEVFKWSHKLSVWWQIWKLRNSILQADIIQIHDVFWWILPVLPLVRIKQKKVFMTFHGYEGNELPTWKQKLAHKSAAVLTDGSLCIGGFHQKWYGVTPTLVSFGAVTAPAHWIVQKKKRTHKKRAVFLGRLEADNGILMYLEALRKLDTTGGWSLDVYGEGSLRKKAEAFAARHKLTVRFHGFVKNADALLGKYDVAFVSRYLSILEALAAKVPVIAYSHNELTKTYIEETPFAKWITVSSSATEVTEQLLHVSELSTEASGWARSQTWQLLSNVYLQLWKTKK